jgi:hypothetical protein
VASRTSNDDDIDTGPAAGQPARPARTPAPGRPGAAATGAATRARRPKFTIYSRSVVIAYCAALCLGILFAYAGRHWMSVLYRLLADGLVLGAWLACAAGLGSAVLLLFPIAEGPPDGPAGRGARPARDPSRVSGSASELLHWVTATALGLGLFSLGTLGLGLAGLLNYSTAVGMLATGAALGIIAFSRSDVWRHRATFGDSTSAWLSAPAGWGWLWLAAMPFLGVAILSSLLPTGVMWPGEPHWYDVVSYHLQLPREWFDLGRIVPLQHNVFSYFPLNVEMHYLLAMHLTGSPWAAMYLAHFMHLAMVVLTVAAIYGFARADAPTRGHAVIAAVAAAVVPWMAQLGSIGYNEGGLLLFGTLAIGWAFRAALNPVRRLGRFPVAGMMAGFACGSKLTGVPEVLLAVGALSALGVVVSHKSGARLRAAASAAAAADASGSADAGGDAPGANGGRPSEPALAYATPPGLSPGPAVDASTLSPEVPLRRRLMGVAAFFAAGLLTFAPWLVKNVAWAGNPVFPEAASLFGQAHFSDTQVERWKQAHAPRPDQRAVGARFAEWTRQVWGNWQYGYLLIPLGLVAAAAAYDRPGTWLLVGMLVLLSVIWLGFTHLQGRFFILAIPIAALLLARMDWGPAVWAGAMLVLLAGFYGYHKLHGVVFERLFAPPHQFALLLAKERLEDAATDIAEVFRSIPPSAPVVAAFVPTLDEVPPGTPVALVGDARAYFYVIPMRGLTYRTVFDVDVKPGQSVLDAWADGAPPNAVRLVDPDELRRFHSHYHGIPSFPTWYEDRMGPFILPPVNAPPQQQQQQPPPPQPGRPTP